MSFYPLLIGLLMLSAAGYWFGSKKALGLARSPAGPVRQGPHQGGLFAFISSPPPPLLLGGVWAAHHVLPLSIERGTGRGIYTVFFPVLAMMLAAGGLCLALRRVGPNLKVRKSIEAVVLAILMLASIISILTTVGIVFSLLFETIQFFRKVPMSEFFFGL